MAELSEPLDVGQMRELIKDLPDDIPVYGHAGWDFKIMEWDLDDRGLILFLDHENEASMVNNSWLVVARTVMRGN